MNDHFEKCQTCSGPIRKTVGMVCQTCGTDYGLAGAPSSAVDHPYTDPGDGRVECQTCGKWVRLVIHSCKGVPVTYEAAMRLLATAWELGFTTSYGMERGYSPTNPPEVPDHLRDDFKAWNPYRSNGEVS